METVVAVFINVFGVVDVIGFQRVFIRRNARVDAVIQCPVLQHQRSLNLGHIRRHRLASVERHCGMQVRAHAHGQIVRHAAAETETYHAQFAGAIGTPFQPSRGRFQIVLHLGAIHGAKCCGSFFFIAGIAAHTGQPIWSKRHIPSRAQPPRYIFYIRIQAAVFMDYQNTGQLAVRAGRANQIAFDLAIASGRRHGFVAGLQTLVVFGDLFGKGVVGAQAFPNRSGGEPTHGKFLGTI